MDDIILRWVLYFFLYCVVGWLWEVFYVSIRKGTLVNRGFLYGPWLPIYGFGAVTILLATLPVREETALVFLCGMVGATALEYVTGALMEKIFHMRYWDYSENFGNLNGHICVFASLGWGVGSVLLTRYLHPPIEWFVSRIPDMLLEGLDLVLVIVFTVDVVRSVEAALNLREILLSMTENGQFLQGVEERMSQMAKQLEAGSDRIRQRMQLAEEQLTERLQEYRDRESRLLLRLEKRASILREEVANSIQRTQGQEELERLKALQETLVSFQETLQKVRSSKAMRREREYHRALSLLRRNPGTVSRRYQKALAELKEKRLQRKERKDK